MANFSFQFTLTKMSRILYIISQLFLADRKCTR